MDLEAFSQDEKPFETLTDLDEYDEAPDDGRSWTNPLLQTIRMTIKRKTRIRQRAEANLLLRKSLCRPTRRPKAECWRRPARPKSTAAYSIRWGMMQGFFFGTAQRKPSYGIFVNPSKRTPWQRQP